MLMRRRNSYERDLVVAANLCHCLVINNRAREKPQLPARENPFLIYDSSYWLPVRSRQNHS